MASHRTRSSLVCFGASLALVVTGWGTPALAQQSPSPIDLDRVVEQDGARDALPGDAAGAEAGGDAGGAGDTGGAGDAGGVGLLSSTPTIQSGPGPQAGPAVKVIKRTGSLWLSKVDGANPAPAQYVDDLEVVQDVPKKRLVATVTYDAPPTAAQNSATFVFFGTWNAAKDACNPKMQLAAIASSASASDATALYTNNKSAGTATRQLSGSTLRITLSGGAAGNAGYDCIYSDSAAATEPLTWLMRSSARDFTAEYEKAPKFDFYSSDLHAAYPGKWNKVTVTVRNEGDATARGLKVSASGAKVKLKKKSFKPGNLAPGKRKTVTLKVKLSGKKTRKLKVTAAATGGWKSSTSTKVGHRPRPKKLGSLSGRSYWANESVSRKGWTVHRLTFVNNNWVYTGSASKVPACRAKVKGCQKYAYSRNSGALRIGKLRAKVNSEGIKVTKAGKKGAAKLNYQPLKTPKAGSRIAVKLKYTDFNGCGMTWSCSTWWQVLTLRKNGTFTRTYSAIHSSGMPGNQTMVSVSGPNPSGKYKILKKGRIQLSYVDEKTKKRKTETHLIGIDSNVLGKFSPKHGLIVGDDPYF